MDNQGASVRLGLRSSTSQLHQRVDALGGRVANVATPDGYRVFLRTMARVATRFAAQLDRSSELAGLAPRSQRIVAALGADLSALGVVVQPVTTPCPDHTDGFAWGVGYALEGSALGAAALLEEVRASPFDLPDSYFSALVDERPGRWAAFTAVLNSIDTEPSLDEAIEGAGAVFDLVEASFHGFSADDQLRVGGQGAVSNHNEVVGNGR